MWWIEGAPGAAGARDVRSAVLRGTHFGLHVDRGRRFEASFPIHMDAALEEGDRLRARTCLGPRRRWLRIDPYGRAVHEPCCAGNVYDVQGVSPVRSSVAANAAAMGIDAGHMRWSSLARATPPAYSELLFGQAAMHEAQRRFGVPVITHDEMTARPSWARRVMSSWLVGAGAAHEEAGMALEAPREPSGAAVRSASVAAGGLDGSPPDEEDGVAVPRGGREARWSEEDWGLSEVDFREVYFTHAGGYDQSLVGGSSPNWLGRFSRRRLDPFAEWESNLVGRNTFVHLPSADWSRLERAAKAAVGRGDGTRLTVVVPTHDAGARARLEQAGFRTLRQFARRTVSRLDGASTVHVAPESDVSVMWAGRRRSSPPSLVLDREVCRVHMDPVDAGTEPKPSAEAKHMRSWTEIPWVFRGSRTAGWGRGFRRRSRR